MLRQDALIRKLQTQFDEFLKPLVAVADRPRQRFLHQSIRASRWWG